MQTENKYLKHKMLNLVSFNNSDRAIFMKLNANEILNPFHYFDKKNLIKFFNENKPINIKDSNWKNIEKELKEKTSSSSFLKAINDLNLYIPKVRINKIKQSLSKYKKETLEYLSKKYSNIDQQIQNINNMAINKEKDSGEWHFYLMRYFIKGKIPKSEEIVNAPLFFAPVFYDSKEKKLVKAEDEKLILNEKLIVMLIKGHQKHNRLFQQWANLSSIEEICDFLKEKFNIDVEINPKTEEFMNLEIETVRKENNQLSIEDVFTLGLAIPTGGRLKNDLNYLISNNIDVFDENLFKNKNGIKEAILNQKNLNIQVSSLNLSQLAAVNLSLENNTIIHGPPGTGKSETIANIMANVLVNDKSSLVVSEKKAALEVLIDRIGELRNFTIYFSNSKEEKNKKEFFDRILKLESLYKENLELEEEDFEVKIPYFNEVFLNWQKENEISKLREIINQWNYNNFTFSEYVLGREKLSINEKYKKITNNQLQNISKRSFLASQKLIAFLKQQTFNDDEMIKFHSSIMEKVKNFYLKLEKFNAFLRTKNINNLSIQEIRKIEDSRKTLISYFEDKKELENIIRNNPNVLEESLNKYEEIKKVFVDDDELFNLELVNFLCLQDNNLSDLKKLFEESSLKRKKLINQWIKNNLNYGYDYKLISNLFKKIKELNMECGSFIKDYIRNKSIFSLANIYFYFSELVFEENVTNYIENEWDDFDIDKLLVMANEKISYDDIELCKKISDFKEIILTNHNIEILEKYRNLIEDIKEITEPDWDEINNIIYKKVLINWINKIKKSNLIENINEIFRIANLKRHPRIIPFIRTYTKEIMELFPVWISKPNDISNILECEEGVFDYGIFDEASQMFLERAYPILFRTKIKIVAGDQKQLKPSSFFTSRIESQIEDDEDYIFEVDLNKEDSLLDRAAVSGWNEMLLNNHYRSISKNLIEFSNKNIYDNKLNIASLNMDLKFKPLEVKNIVGYFIDGINEEEGKEVMVQLEKNIELFNKIIIITFNISQSLYITSLINKNKKNNKLIKEKLKNGKLIVTNLENVQGNEGDLVIISVAYGKSPKTFKLRNAYGPLSMAGGKNRLNVALTRAKSKMIIVKSLVANEMNINHENENALCFKNLIEYLDDFTSNQNLQKYNYFEKSDLLKDIYEKINKYISFDKKRYKLISDYDIGNSNFDLVFFDEKKSNVKLGLKVTSMSLENDNFLERGDWNKFIESRKFNVIEIQELDWLISKVTYIEKIEKKLKD